jgi:hypothetical protein
VLLFSAKTQDTLKAHIAEDMANLVQYCNSNLIKINIKKTKVLPFGSQSTAIDNFSPSVNGELLEIVNEFKYLGYIIDSKINFKMEAKRVYSRLQSCRYLLNRCKGYVSIDLLKLLFNCTALVHATYSSTMLLYIGKLQAKKLTKVMLNIGKAIHGCSDEKHSTLNWPSFYQLILRSIYGLLHNIINRGFAPYLSELLHLTSHNHNTRRKMLFYRTHYQILIFIIFTHGTCTHQFITTRFIIRGNTLLSISCAT